MAQRSSPIFSRIIMLLLAAASLGAAFWFGMQALEPVPVPPPPPAKTRVSFNAKADVSQNAVFQRLEPFGTASVAPGELGRVNPFVPVTAPSFVVPTSTTPTSTEEALPEEGATSTPPVSDLPPFLDPLELEMENRPGLGL